MCESCDLWVRARHDPNWVPPNGKRIGFPMRPKLTPEERFDIKLGKAPR
jgi:hypothetical protein